MTYFLINVICFSPGLQIGEFIYMASTLVMAFESFAGDDHEVGLFHRAFFIAFMVNRCVLLLMYWKIMLDVPLTKDQNIIHIQMLVRTVCLVETGKSHRAQLTRYSRCMCMY